jgi:hypothetical protein
MATTRHAAAFLSAVQQSWDLATTPEVLAAWGRESSCAGMTVGGLANHLLGQGVNTAKALRADPAGSPEPIALLEHYAGAAWVEAGPDDEVNARIRDTDNASALAGPDAVLAAAREHVDALPELLAAPRDPDIIFIPWQGWSLSTDDFLTTRMMEMVVHGDDLASSVGLPTPAYAEDVITPVLGLLSGVAVRRHGQTALVRALARPQRAETGISAF